MQSEGGEPWLTRRSIRARRWPPTTRGSITVVVKPEDLVPLSPLVRIDLTAVPLGECAAIGGGKVMPSREVTDQIGSGGGHARSSRKRAAVTKLERGLHVHGCRAGRATWVGRATRG